MWLIGRGIQILGIIAFHWVITTWSFVIALLCGRPGARQHYYSGSVRLLEHLGPTFVKLGQVVSVRRDMLPAALCDQLATLRDKATPMNEAETRNVLRAAYGDGPTALLTYDQLELVASGSIASVFRGPSIDGVEVAVKIKRPRIHHRMMGDLALLQAFARAAECLPKCRGMPLGDLTEYVTKSVLGQLDFQREALSLSRIRAELAQIPNIRVPAVLMNACRPDCLVMEFIPGLAASNSGLHSPAERQRLALVALRAVSQMIFTNGFVHCDLHPGNLYVTDAGEVVILDLGFNAELPERTRLLIGEFFTQMACGHGRRCAEIIIESAVEIPPDSNLDEFVERMENLIDAHCRQSAPHLAFMTFGNAIFDLQREFGLFAESNFVFPLLALSIFEGTLQTLCPGLDFRVLGRFGVSYKSSNGQSSVVLARLADGPTDWHHSISAPVRRN